MLLDLSDEEMRALMALLKRTLDNVRYPLSRPGRAPQRGAADLRWAAMHVSGR